MAHPAIKLIQQSGRPIGHPFIELPTVESTNNYAMAKVHAGLASHGTIFFAHEQTRGKGQRGKTWVSAPGENIIISLVLEPIPLRPEQQFGLSISIALACYDLLIQYIPEELSIKWPNDLYWRDRKAGGILIESICKGKEWLYAIVGIGINVNQSHFPDIRQAVSLKQLTGNNYSSVGLAKELCQCINDRYDRLIQEGLQNILQEYNQHLFQRGQKVQLKWREQLLETTIIEVTEQGQLITQDLETRTFDLGEIEWVIGT